MTPSTKWEDGFLRQKPRTCSNCDRRDGSVRKDTYAGHMMCKWCRTAYFKGVRDRDQRGAGLPALDDAG